MSFVNEILGRPGPPVVPGYAVSRPVGRGATGTVWAAVEEDGGTEVALKIPDPAAYQPAELLAQAAREIAVLEGVAAEHVVRLRRIVHLPGGGVALVLDLAEGGSLADLVAARGRLGEGEVATVCTALATALAELHDAGVIHGDLTAGNVLFTREGKPMIADFASARLVGESDPPLIAGTPGFVAPEVARGDIPTEASDAYGLGALAWFALTGMPRTAGPPDEAEAVGFVGREMGPVVWPLLAAEPPARPGLLEAAGAFYAAATPVPVRLVDGPGDSAVALTRRIRAQAAADEGTPRRAAGRHASGAGPRGAAARWVRSRRGALRTRVARLPWRALGRVVGILIAMAGLFVVGRVLGARLVEAGPAPAAVLASDAPAADPAAAGAPDGAGAPPATHPPPSPAAQVRADPRAVLTAIADARAAAIVAADPEALKQVEAPESPMHRHDTNLIATLAAAQRSYAGLSFTVQSAELVSGEGDTAAVRAVVDRSAYRVLGPGERSETVGAQAGTSHTYRLALADGRWRLVTIE
jgi:hypothetical protein